MKAQADVLFMILLMISAIILAIVSGGFLPV